MTKKLSRFLFLMITMLFIGFTAGVLVGRQAKNPGTLSSSYDQIAVETAQELAGQERPSVGRININTATVAELDMLPGIGKAMAQKIIDYRTQNGDFSNIYELSKVSGISKEKMMELMEYITVGG